MCFWYTTVSLAGMVVSAFGRLIPPLDFFMAKLSDCIGLFSVRKILRFELTPLFATAERLQPMLSADEDRAAALYKTKAVIEAEHLTMVRRVFETLSDPMPADPRVIVRAAQADPEYAMLHGSDAGRVLGLVVDRCRRERRPLPSALKDLLPWSSLYVKWHWHCAGRLDFKGAKGLAWALSRAILVPTRLRCRSRLRTWNVTVCIASRQAHCRFCDALRRPRSIARRKVVVFCCSKCRAEPCAAEAT